MGIKRDSVWASFEFEYDDPQTGESFHIKFYHADQVGPVVKVTTTQQSPEESIVLSASMFAEIGDFLREKHVIDGSSEPQAVPPSKPSRKTPAKKQQVSIETSGGGNLPATRLIRHGKTADVEHPEEINPESFQEIDVTPVENFAQFHLPQTQAIVNNIPQAPQDSPSPSANTSELPATQIVSATPAPTPIEIQQEEQGDQIVNRPVIRGVESIEEASALRGFNADRVIRRKGD